MTDLTPELLELATTPREVGYTAIIVENIKPADTDEDVWQAWIQEGSLL